MTVGVQAAYLVAIILFVLSLKWMSSPPSARRGVLAGEVGMAIAVLATVFAIWPPNNLGWILAAFLIGSAIGIPMAVFMPMTAMPQRIALSHAFGALAAALVGTSEYYLNQPRLSAFTMGAIGFEVLLGFLTFTGSLMAFGKLQGFLPQRPIVYRGQNAVNLTLFAIAVAALAVRVSTAPLAACTWPKAPKSTLVNERFIARHMITERMKPEAPSSAPATINTGLPRTNPIAAPASPA